MQKEIIIADAHSQNKPKQTMKLELSGGSPWFGYLYIDDVLFAVYKHGVTGKISIKRPSSALA